MCSITAAVAIASLAFQVKTQQDSARYKKGTSRYNSRVAENQAQDVRNAGNEAENVQRQKIAQVLSKQRAQLGSSGIEIDSGSALQLQNDTLLLGEADALRIRNNVQSQVGVLQTTSQLELNRGDQAGVIANNQSAGTILSGGSAVINSGVADKWFSPESAANQIQDQTGFSGGTSGVLSGEEFDNF